MRKLVILFFATVALMVNAQNKIDYSGMVVDPRSTDDVVVIIEMNDAKGGFGQCDVNVMTQVADMVIASIPANQLDKVAALPQVKRITLSTAAEKRSDSEQFSRPVSTPKLIDDAPAKPQCCSERAIKNVPTGCCAKEAKPKVEDPCCGNCKDKKAEKPCCKDGKTSKKDKKSMKKMRKGNKVR